MAGKTIYTGDMIAALESKIDTMTGKLDTMITDLAAHTTKLGEISAGVSQGIASLNVKSGTTDESIIINTAIVEKILTAQNTSYSLLIGFKAFCRGVVRFDTEVFSDASYGSFQLGYSVNGAAAVYPLTGLSLTTTPAAKNFDIAVNPGDSITIQAQNTAAAGKKIKLSANSTIKYDLIDIVSEGALTLSGL